MIPTQIQSNIVRIDTPAVYAYYIVKSSALYPLALVCDDNDVLIGVIGDLEINPVNIDISEKSCGEICMRNFMSLKNEDEDSIYGKARNIFADKNLRTLPVIDENGVPIRLFGKFQAFFRENYKSLPYFYYAYGLMDAAKQSKSYGYDRISALEFGVAGGRGLMYLELYAKEISRIVGINIDVYGFDSGTGLLPPVDYRDCPQRWMGGDYKMNFEALKKKLHSAKLVIGNICETTKTFLTDYAPAPIAFISVDVDLYTPTVAILDMLLEDDKYFVPIITMYFDDIFDDIEFQGETLALKEFNKKSETIKISPEHSDFNRVRLRSEIEHTQWVANNLITRLKWCNRFNHPNFVPKRTKNYLLPL